jgi:shikimate kinase
VWLEVGLVDAARRTGLSGARPVALGNVRGQLHDMLKQWAQVYGGLADLQVTTDGRDPVDIIEEIMEWEAAL